MGDCPKWQADGVCGHLPGDLQCTDVLTTPACLKAAEIREHVKAGVYRIMLNNSDVIDPYLQGGGSVEIVRSIFDQLFKAAWADFQVGKLNDG